jgi:IMP cyclohydrolase
MKNMNELLAANPYPGRGIMIGKSADGKYGVIAYFIMGRSENSRNRVFLPTEDGIRTEAHDPSKLVDPSLIIYHPVRVSHGKTIVTNGDQTDTIYDALEAGHCYRHALITRTFEPDPPHYTPRISGVLLPNGDYKLSILKSNDGDPSTTLRYFYEYFDAQPGCGRFIHTYAREAERLESFEGEPVSVAVIAPDAHALADSLWNSLNEANKVALFTRYVDLATGETDDCIINKLG